MSESRCFCLKRKVPKSPVAFLNACTHTHTHTHAQKLRPPHLPSPDGVPCARVSSRSRIFRRWRKLLPCRSLAPVLAQSVRPSSGWGAAGSGPRSPPLAVRLPGGGKPPAAPAASPCAPAARSTGALHHSRRPLLLRRSARPGAPARSSTQPVPPRAREPAGDIRAPRSAGQ